MREKREMSLLAKSVYKREEYLIERIPTLSKEIEEMKDDLLKVKSKYLKIIIEMEIKQKERMLSRMVIELEEF